MNSPEKRSNFKSKIEQNILQFTKKNLSELQKLLNLKSVKSVIATLSSVAASGLIAFNINTRAVRAQSLNTTAINNEPNTEQVDQNRESPSQPEINTVQDNLNKIDSTQAVDLLVQKHATFNLTPETTNTKINPQVQQETISPEANNSPTNPKIETNLQPQSTEQTQSIEGSGQNIEPTEQVETETKPSLANRLRKIKNSRNTTEATKAVLQAPEAQTNSGNKQTIPAPKQTIIRNEQPTSKPTIQKSQGYELNASLAELEKLNSYFNTSDSSQKPSPQISSQESKSQTRQNTSSAINQSSELKSPEDLNQYLTKQPKNTATQQNITTQSETLKLTPQQEKDFLEAFGDTTDQFLVNIPTPQTPDKLSQAISARAQDKKAREQYLGALAQALPSTYTPQGIPTNAFNPSKKDNLSISTNFNPGVNPTVNIQKTHLIDTFVGTNQDKKQLVTSVSGNNYSLQHFGDAKLTTGKIKSVTVENFLPFQQLIGAGPNLPKTDRKNYDITTTVQAVQTNNPNVNVNFNGTEFDLNSFPKTPLDALNQTPIDGKVFQTFPTNAPQISSFAVGSSIPEDWNIGKITQKPGIVAISSLPQSAQDYINGTASPAQARDEYLKKAFFWSLGTTNTQTLNIESEIQKNIYSLRQSNFTQQTKTDFDPKGNANFNSSYRRKSSLNLVFNANPTNPELDLRTTAKEYLASLPAYIPLNRDIQKAVNEQRQNQKPISGPNDLTIKFGPAITPKAAQSLNNVNRTNAILNTFALPNQSFGEDSVWASSKKFSGISIQAGELQVPYSFSQVMTGTKKPTTYKTITSVSTPVDDGISNVYTIFRQKNNLTGEETFQKYNLPVGMTGGFGSLSTGQQFKTPYYKTIYVGNDVLPAFRASAVVGNQKTILAGAATLAINPLPNSLPGNIKQSTPSVIGQVNLLAAYNFDSRFSVQTNAKFSTSATVANPNTVFVSVNYQNQSKNSAFSASVGGVYLNAGPKTVPAVLPVANAELRVGKTTASASLLGPQINAEVNQDFGKGKRIGVFVRNTQLNSTLLNQPTATQPNSNLNFGIQGNIQVNKNIGVNGFIGVNGDYYLGIKYQKDW